MRVTRLLGSVLALGLLLASCGGGREGGGRFPRAAGTPAPGSTAAPQVGTGEPAPPAGGAPATGATRRSSGSTARVSSPGTGSTGKGAAPGAPAAPGDTTGVGPDTVTIGFIFAQSGPYGAIARNFAPAIDAALREVNAAGGVHGRRLVPLFGDDGYNNASVALATAKSMKDKAFGISSIVFNTFAAIHEFLDQNRVPYLYGNADRAAGLRLRYGFPGTTFLQTQAELLPRFMVAKFGAASKRVGIIFQDTPDLKPAVTSFKDKAAEAGLNVVITQQVSETPSTCVNEVANLQSSRAEVVWLAVAPLPAICILRDADTIGYRPTWTGTSNSFNFNITNTASGCKTEGMVTMSAWRTLESPEGQRYQAALRKYYPNNPDAPDDDLAYIGWGLANLWAEALRRAGPTPTRESFVAGMETLRAWDGGQFAPLTFGPGDRLGSRAVLTSQVRNCRWVIIDPVWRDRF